MKTLAKTKNLKRTVFDINRTIRTLPYHPECSWLNGFTMQPNTYFKQVHVIGNSAYLMLMSIKSNKKGSYITGSLEYPLDNLPNFIKRHIDFSKLNELKSLKVRAFGLFFKDGKLLENA